MVRFCLTFALLATACASDDGGSTSSGGESDGTTTEATTGATTEATTGATTGATGATTGSMTSGGSGSASSGATTGDPVTCGENTCAAGQICVQLGLRCDYNMDPPMFYTPEPTCESVPDSCAGMEEPGLTNCIASEFCQDTVCGQLTTLEAGLLECEDHDCDCF